MTVIAARVFEDRIDFAADTLSVSGWLRHTSQDLKLGKLCQVNGMTIGGAGTRAHSQWLMAFARNHAPLDASESSVSEFMLEFDQYMRAKRSDFTSGNRYLIAFRDKLFRVYDELSVFEIPVFSAVGAGEDYALTALHLGKSPKEAVEVATVFSLLCDGDVECVSHMRN